MKYWIGLALGCIVALMAAWAFMPPDILAFTSLPANGQAAHGRRVAIQVDQNDKAVMDLTLNNANNVAEYYQSKGEAVEIEIVTFGPGLHMLRADTSPVKERIAAMSLQHANIKFAACGNTRANMSRAEGKPIELVSEAQVTPSGVVRLMELQREGYAYIRP